MKKLIIVSLIAAAAAVILAACTSNGGSGADDNTGKGAQLANPVSAAESLAEINEKIGCRMKSPENASDELFFIINGTLGEYRFNINGAEYYNFRASKTDKDISGVYVDGGTVLAVYDGNNVTVELGDGKFYTRWFDGDMQYSLYAENDTKEHFEAVAGELKK